MVRGQKKKRAGDDTRRLQHMNPFGPLGQKLKLLGGKHHPAHSKPPMGSWEDRKRRHRIVEKVLSQEIEQELDEPSIQFLALAMLFSTEAARKRMERILSEGVPVYRRVGDRLQRVR